MILFGEACLLVDFFVCKGFDNLSPGKFYDSSINYKKQWKSPQSLSNMFWKIFIKADVSIQAIGSKRQKFCAKRNSVRSKHQFTIQVLGGCMNY